MCFICLWLLWPVADILLNRETRWLLWGFLWHFRRVFLYSLGVGLLIGFFPPFSDPCLWSFFLLWSMSTRFGPILVLLDRSSRHVERCPLCTQQYSVSFIAITVPALLAWDLHVTGQLSSTLYSTVSQKTCELLLGLYSCLLSPVDFEVFSDFYVFVRSLCSVYLLTEHRPSSLL